MDTMDTTDTTRAISSPRHPSNPNDSSRVSLFSRLSHPSRRDALTWMGVAGLAVLAEACAAGPTSTATGSSSPASTGASSTTSSGTNAAGSIPTTTTAVAGATGASCVLTPEQTEGPYYLDLELVRRDITEGRSGAPLRLALDVVDATTCAPIRDAVVDIWHCDATGSYSGVGGAGAPGGNRQATTTTAAAAAGGTYLRGMQISDAAGKVEFQTIYPGWYQGRTTHIHIKVHVGTNVVHTGQLYFDDALTKTVAQRSPYQSHGTPDTTNATDSIYRNGGAQSVIAVTPDGDGYIGRLMMGVDPKATGR